MSQTEEHGKRLAQNLVELLASYEEELMLLERASPAYGPLRRAVGIVIAEACFCISDRAAIENGAFAPPAADQTRSS